MQSLIATCVSAIPAWFLNWIVRERWHCSGCRNFQVLPRMPVMQVVARGIIVNTTQKIYYISYCTILCAFEYIKGANCDYKMHPHFLLHPWKEVHGLETTLRMRRHINMCGIDVVIGLQWHDFFKSQNSMSTTYKVFDTLHPNSCIGQSKGMIYTSIQDSMRMWYRIHIHIWSIQWDEIYTNNNIMTYNYNDIHFKSRINVDMVPMSNGWQRP